MKKLLLILYIVPLLSYANDSIFSVINKANIDSIATQIDKSDSLIIDLQKGEENNIPIINNGKTKVVLLKEKNSTDFLRYIIPILTLFLGVGLNKLLDSYSEKKKIKKSGRRWIAEIRSLKKPLENQIEELEKFLVEHQKENFITPIITTYSSLSGESFKSLDKGEFIKYIELTKKSDFQEVIKISNKTHGYISVLSSLFEVLKDKFNAYLPRASIHVTSLSSNLQSLLRAFTDGVLIKKEIEQYHVDGSYRLIANLFSTQIFSKRDNGDYNPYELETNFLMPLLKILDQLRKDERMTKLIKYSSKCLNDIKGIKMEKRYMSENLTFIIDRYKTQLNSLDEIIADCEK